MQQEVDACAEEENKKSAAAAFIGQKLNASLDFQKFNNQNQGLQDFVSEKEAQNEENKDEDETRRSSLMTEESITVLEYSKQSSIMTDFESLNKDELEEEDVKSKLKSNISKIVIKYGIKKIENKF